MAAQEVLREFLVSLGWSNDEVAAKKIFESIGKMEKSLVGVVIAAEAAALGVVAALGKMAQGFEKAYYQSSRTGSTVAALNAFKYAASQTGSSADEASAAVENLALKIRENRGFRTLVQGITGDKSNDVTRQITELGAAFSRMTSEQAHATASLLGMPEHLLLALQNPEFAKYQAEYQAKARAMGVDLEKAAQDGKSLTQALRDVRSTLDLIVDSADSPLFQQLDKPLRDLNAFLLAHGKDIADILGRIAGALLKLFTAVLEHLPDLDRLAERMGGWETVFAGLAAVISIAFVGRLAGMFGSLRALSLLGMPPWLLAVLGVGAGASWGLKKIHEGASAESMPSFSEAGDQTGPEKFYGKVKSFFGFNGEANNAIRARGRKAHIQRNAEGPAGVPYEGKSIKEAMGLTDKEWDAYREGVTDIEGKSYGRMGGAGGRFAGRYQMGGAEITDTARRLGVPRPTTEAFLADPQMQERFFENYTLDHMKTLMNNPRFAGMSKKEKLQILGYAHNQGAGSARRNSGAMGYLNGGGVGHDAFGTGGDAYFGPIGRRFDQAQGPKRTAPMLKASPGSPGLVPTPNPLYPGQTTFNPSIAAPPLGSQSSGDSKNITVIDNSKTSVSGVSDPQKAADHIGRIGDRQSSLLLRNVQSAVG